jgi:regulator of protease activity HflC (stomatin/prohibitin superfamily)
VSTLALDTYALVSKLKDNGFTEQQAAANVEAITKAIDTALEQARHDYHLDELATKRELRELELKIELIRSDLKKDIAESKAELIRWVVGMVAGVGFLQISIITALILKLTNTI